MNAENVQMTGKSPERVRLGTPEMRGSGKTELSLISAVNEAVKGAIDDSHGIGLIAINASLIAGRAGNRAAGFCVVASELRQFSEGMASDMAGWSRLIEGLVHVTATGRRQAHMLYKLQDTARRSEKAKAAIAVACDRSRQSIDVTTIKTSGQVKALLDLIQRSSKQQLRGEMIARSAQIEAAYGGNMHGVLRDIAESVGERIGRFAEHIENVETQMRRAVT